MNVLKLKYIAEDVFDGSDLKHNIYKFVESFLEAYKDKIRIYIENKPLDGILLCICKDGDEALKNIILDIDNNILENGYKPGSITLENKSDYILDVYTKYLIKDFDIKDVKLVSLDVEYALNKIEDLDNIKSIQVNIIKEKKREV